MKGSELRREKRGSVHLKKQYMIKSLDSDIYSNMQRPYSLVSILGLSL